MLDTKEIQEDIKNAKHILLHTDNASFANASAIYTYLLTLHKKVSLYSEDALAYKFSFLPWYSKIKRVKASSADLVLPVNADVLGYYDFFVSNGIKINVKMATALYSALLLEYENFQSVLTDGIVFATANQLIDLGAEYKNAQKSIAKSESLALFRLRAVMYKHMLLSRSAQELQMYVSDADLTATGATIDDAYKVMREGLSLVHVKKVVLKKSDENMKVLKTITEEMRFEK